MLHSIHLLQINGNNYNKNTYKSLYICIIRIQCSLGLIIIIVIIIKQTGSNNNLYIIVQNINSPSSFLCNKNRNNKNNISIIINKFDNLILKISLLLLLFCCLPGCRTPHNFLFLYYFISAAKRKTKQNYCRVINTATLLVIILILYSWIELLGYGESNTLSPPSMYLEMCLANLVLCISNVNRDSIQYIYIV